MYSDMTISSVRVQAESESLQYARHKRDTNPQTLAKRDHTIRKSLRACIFKNPLLTRIFLDSSELTSSSSSLSKEPFLFSP